MKIGLAGIFAWRPHLEHLMYLGQLLRTAGHETSHLTCDAAVSSCYPRALKAHSALRECPKCVIGGVRSYPVKHIVPLRAASAPHLSRATLQSLTASSSYTIARIETTADQTRPEVLQLQDDLLAPVATFYQNAVDWITKEQLDAVLLFNGRMDVTAAVLRACKDAATPFATLERSLEHGIMLTPNANCLSFKELARLLAQYREIPLTHTQARIAAAAGARRFLHHNIHEWRQYNIHGVTTPWPLRASTPRVLILPSSHNEFAGHPEWASDWPDSTIAIDEALGALAVQHQACVLRCHPNWAQHIGHNTGKLSEGHYTAWAKHRGVHCIGSAERASTQSLIEQADIVIVNGSTAAIEAGLCGKVTICLGPSRYQESGHTVSLTSRGDWHKLATIDEIRPAEVVRQTLRYLYFVLRRWPQYVPYVRAVGPLKSVYYEGGDAGRIIELLNTGRVTADDQICADDQEEEDEVLEKVLMRDWQTLGAWSEPSVERRRMFIHRRWLLRWLDPFRDLLARGDESARRS